MTKEREAKQITPSVPFFCRYFPREKLRRVRTFFKRQESGRCAEAAPSSKLRSHCLLFCCDHVAETNGSLQALHSRGQLICGHIHAFCN